MPGQRAPFAAVQEAMGGDLDWRRSMKQTLLCEFHRHHCRRRMRSFGAAGSLLLDGRAIKEMRCLEENLFAGSGGCFFFERRPRHAFINTSTVHRRIHKITRAGLPDELAQADVKTWMHTSKTWQGGRGSSSDGARCYVALQAV